MSATSDREVQATRAQMELARLLGVPFAADQQSQERAEHDHTGYLVPGLPDAHGLTPIRLSLPLSALLDLVDAARAQHPAT